MFRAAAVEEEAPDPTDAEEEWRLRPLLLAVLLLLFGLSLDDSVSSKVHCRMALAMRAMPSRAPGEWGEMNP